MPNDAPDFLRKLLAAPSAATMRQLLAQGAPVVVAGKVERTKRGVEPTAGEQVLAAIQAGFVVAAADRTSEPHASDGIIGLQSHFDPALTEPLLRRVREELVANLGSFGGRAVVLEHLGDRLRDVSLRHVAWVCALFGAAKKGSLNLSELSCLTDLAAAFAISIEKQIDLLFAALPHAAPRLTPILRDNDRERARVKSAPRKARATKRVTQSVV